MEGEEDFDECDGIDEHMQQELGDNNNPYSFRINENNIRKKDMDNFH